MTTFKNQGETKTDTTKQSKIWKQLKLIAALGIIMEEENRPYKRHETELHFGIRSTEQCVKCKRQAE
jgi:hypothetical protein